MNLDLIRKILICLVLVLLGILIGNYLILPGIEFQKEINIVDIASLIVTSIIAILIPVYITKIIDDNRGVKICIIDEIKDLICIVSKAKNLVTKAYELGVFCEKDRDLIINTFHEADLRAYSFEEQIKIAYPNNSTETVNVVKGLLNAYNEFLTGGVLMMSTFVRVDDRFYNENNTEYMKIETGLKTLTQKVHKF